MSKYESNKYKFNIIQTMFYYLYLINIIKREYKTTTICPRRTKDMFVNLASFDGFSTDFCCVRTTVVDRMVAHGLM